MDDDDSIPISLVAQWIYCPRRAWLEAAGERTDTFQMQVGMEDHRNVDDPSTAAANEIRSLDVEQHELMITGRLDSIKETETGFIITEYKATPVKRQPEITQAMRIQLALQVMCLEDMGYKVAGTEVFFTSHHRNIQVQLEEVDYQDARYAVDETRKVVTADAAPLPLDDDEKCENCSHAGVCLPEERKLKPIRHSIRVADPDSQLVHLATPGSYAKVKQG